MCKSGPTGRLDVPSGRVSEDRKRHVDGELARERRQRDHAAGDRQVGRDDVDSQSCGDRLGVIAAERRTHVHGLVVGRPVRAGVVRRVVDWYVQRLVGQ